MKIASVTDYREAARRRIPHFLFEYIDGGANAPAAKKAAEAAPAAAPAAAAAPATAKTAVEARARSFKVRMGSISRKGGRRLRPPPGRRG